MTSETERAEAQESRIVVVAEAQACESRVMATQQRAAQRSGADRQRRALVEAVHLVRGPT